MKPLPVQLEPIQIGTAPYWSFLAVCVALQGKSFSFDRVFPTNTTQEQVYNTSAKQIVKGGTAMVARRE